MGGKGIGILEFIGGYDMWDWDSTVASLIGFIGLLVGISWYTFPYFNT